MGYFHCGCEADKSLAMLSCQYGPKSSTLLKPYDEEIREVWRQTGFNPLLARCD